MSIETNYWLHECPVTFLFNLGWVAWLKKLVTFMSRHGVWVNFYLNVDANFNDTLYSVLFNSMKQCLLSIKANSAIWIRRQLAIFEKSFLYTKVKNWNFKWKFCRGCEWNCSVIFCRHVFSFKMIFERSFFVLTSSINNSYLFLAETLMPVWSTYIVLQNPMKKWGNGLKPLSKAWHNNWDWIPKSHQDKLLAINKGEGKEEGRERQC